MFRVVKHENKLALSWISWDFYPQDCRALGGVVFLLVAVICSVISVKLWMEKQSGLFPQHSDLPTRLLAHNMLVFAFQAWSSFIFTPRGAQGNRHTVPWWWWWCIGTGCQVKGCCQMPVCKTLIGFPTSLFRMTSQKLENSISFPAAFSHLCLEDSFPTGEKNRCF